MSLYYNTSCFSKLVLLIYWDIEVLTTESQTIFFILYLLENKYTIFSTPHFCVSRIKDKRLYMLHSYWPQYKLHDNERRFSIL